MNFPVWELEMGGGVLMAVVSVLHVFVAHFAVGGGLWLVLTERAARASGDQGMLDYVRRHSRVFLLITLVFGAITGVGIWFTAALISPSAITALIKAYLWGWAMEWVFFVVEISAALAYWYGWEKMSARTHMAVGWIYFVGAFMSLVIINGIVTFMLTPGGWLENREFWTGFFNPTYWPSLAVRTFAAAALAGLFTLLTASLLREGGLRDRLVRRNAWWVLIGATAAAAAGYWYRARFPGWDAAMLGAIPVLPTVAAWLRWSVAAVIALSLWPLIRPARWHAISAVLLLATALAAFGAGEWLREAGRKPYTINGYLYSTGVLAGEQEAALAADGVLAHTKWADPAIVAQGDPVLVGGELYRNWCAQCHTRDGYNGLLPHLTHWDEETVVELLPRLYSMRALMPPWYGNERETAALAAYLDDMARDAAAGWPGDPRAAGELAWDLSCGLCHTADGFRPLRESLAGLDRGELEEMLDMLQEYTDQMPPYTADPVERGHLLRHMEGLAGADGPAALAERSAR